MSRREEKKKRQTTKVKYTAGAEKKGERKDEGKEGWKEGRKKLDVYIARPSLPVGIMVGR